MIKNIIFALALIPAAIHAGDSDNDIQSLDTNPTLPGYSDVEHIDWKKEFYLRTSLYTKPIQHVADDTITGALFSPQSEFDKSLNIVIEAVKTDSINIHQKEQLVDAAAWGEARNINSALGLHRLVMAFPCTVFLALLAHCIDRHQNPDIIGSSLIAICSILIVVTCINYQAERVKNKRRNMLYDGLRKTIKDFNNQIEESNRRTRDKFYKHRSRELYKFYKKRYGLN